MRDQEDNPLKDQYGQRLDDGDDTDADSSGERDLGGYPDMGVESSVKKEWDALNFYLPDGQIDRINDIYRDLRYESDDRLQKGRHFYPLLVQLGLERVDGMDVDEVKERLESIEG